jgi:thiamine biosynthesis lipoprotein ApbE
MREQRSQQSTWEALGTTVQLRVSDPGGLAPARAAVERELIAIDLACSRFRADSELSRVNAQTGRTVRVSELFRDALALALRAAELTDGDVDPTVGRALELAGYDRDWKLLTAASDQPQPPVTVTARLLTGWRTVSLDAARQTVRLPEGVVLDLGATAKAWVADRAAAAAAATAGCGALVNVGGDIAVCGDPPARGWQIHVTDDHHSHFSAPGQTISILDGGLATSSTAVRRWSHAGHTMHHVIDPGSGAPVRDTWRTVSVAGATCADANIAATAALVRATRAPRWLAEQGLPARLVSWDGTITTVGGWPAEIALAT